MAVNYNEQLLARAEAYLAKPERERRLTRAALDELLGIYNEITGQRRTWCPSCEYQDFYSVVVAYIREATNIFHPEIMSNSNYTIAAGFENEQFVHENWSKVVTAANFTDEDADFFIKNGGAHLFVKKDAPKSEKTGTEGKPPTEKQQRTARFTELFGVAPEEKLTIAQLTEHIEAKEADSAYEVPAA